MERGVDLLALALLMATLRDWFVICQRRVPVVFKVGVLGDGELVEGGRGTWDGERYLEVGGEHAGCDNEV